MQSTSHGSSPSSNGLVLKNNVQSDSSISQGSNDYSGPVDIASHLNRYTISITTSPVKNKCDRFCRCQCHINTSYTTPRWMRFFIGTLYISYSGTPLLNRRPCNYLRCRKSGSPTSNFIYYFPGWMVSRVLSVTGRHDDLNGIGASWTVRIPRVISEESDIWRRVRFGSAAVLLDTFREGLASPFDVSCHGMSLLAVCISFFYS